jgi:hypothetical protein
MHDINFKMKALSTLHARRTNTEVSHGYKGLIMLSTQRVVAALNCPPIVHLLRTVALNLGFKISKTSTYVSPWPCNRPMVVSTKHAPATEDT